MDEVVMKCAKGAAMALDCEVSFTEGFGAFADMVRVPALEEEVTQVLETMGRQVEEVRTANGSSDVGNVSYHCPTIQPLLAISDTFYALHTVEFREETVKPAAHEAIAVGAELIAALMYRTLTDDDFRRRVYDSYLESKAKKMSL